MEGLLTVHCFTKPAGLRSHPELFLCDSSISSLTELFILALWQHVASDVGNFLKICTPVPYKYICKFHLVSVFNHDYVMSLVLI